MSLLSAAQSPNSLSQSSHYSQLCVYLKKKKAKYLYVLYNYVLGLDIHYSIAIQKAINLILPKTT